MDRVIQSPTDMASLLLRSCPDEAASFARRTYRNAADSANGRWTEFWQGVLDILTAAPGPSDLPAGT